MINKECETESLPGEEAGGLLFEGALIGEATIEAGAYLRGLLFGSYLLHVMYKIIY